MVNVSVEVPFTRIGLGANCLEIEGGEIAVKVSVAEPPGPVFVPPSVEETNPLTFVCGPEVVAVMVIPVVVQDTLAARVPPLKEIMLGAVVDRVPPHIVVGPVVATVNPVGKVSVNATSVAARLL